MAQGLPLPLRLRLEPMHPFLILGQIVLYSPPGRARRGKDMQSRANLRITARRISPSAVWISAFAGTTKVCNRFARRVRSQKSCLAPPAKIFLFYRSSIGCMVSPVPHRQRGVRVVTNVERNAVDVKGLSDERLAFMDGEVVWSWRPKVWRQVGDDAFASRR
jgi:hypothetical protein